MILVGAKRRDSDHMEALGRIEGWTRDRFALPGDAVVMVTEIVCGVPGCPPLETVIAFWTGDETRYRLKIFKRVTEVAESDLPVRWLLPALEDFGDLDCC